MPYSVEICNEQDETIEESGFSGGVIGSWCNLAFEHNLPLLASIYDEAFYEGMNFYEDRLVQLAAEVAILKQHLDDQREANQPSKNTDIKPCSKPTSIERFEALIQKAVAVNGSLYIC